MLSTVAALLLLACANAADKPPLRSAKLPAAASSPIHQPSLFPTAPNAAPNGEIPDWMVDDIRQIRRGLNLNPLAGTSLEQIAAEPAHDSGDKTSGDKNVQPSPEMASDSDFANALRAFAPGPAGPSNAETTSSSGHAPAGRLHPLAAGSEYAASLQSAARQLAFRAEELESGGAYEQADHLRRLARQLRREARAPSK
jgi:hypothetical protein